MRARARQLLQRLIDLGHFAEFAELSQLADELAGSRGLSGS